MSVSGAKPDWRDVLERSFEAQADSSIARFFQLATTRLDGAPSARTVVFRGWSDDGRLLISTDARSAKVGELGRESRAEACWWLASTREQFRIAGVAEVATAGNTAFASERVRVWRALSPAACGTFGWPAPGTPVDVPRPTDRTPISAQDPPETFALILLEALRVDHLDLRPDPHIRRLHVRGADGTWSTVGIHP